MGALSCRLKRSAEALLDESEYYGNARCPKLEEYSYKDIAKAYLEIYERCTEFERLYRSCKQKANNYERVSTENKELRKKLYDDNKEYIQQEVEKRIIRSNTNTVTIIESKYSDKYKGLIRERDNKIEELLTEKEGLEKSVECWKSKFMKQAEANATLIEKLLGK